MLQCGWTLKNIMLSKRSQMQKTTYCMIPFIWTIRKRQIYRDRKQISGCLGLGVEAGMTCKQAQWNFLGWWKWSKTGMWWWLHNSINLIKIIELYMYNKWILWYIIYASINLFKKKGFRYVYGWEIYDVCQTLLILREHLMKKIYLPPWYP